MAWGTRVRAVVAVGDAMVGTLYMHYFKDHLV